MRIGLIPLDERPVNTRYPAMIAEIAGVQVVQPPRDLLSVIRQPARSRQLVEWLQAQSSALDALVVSVEMLGFGGLIASRITDEPSHAILTRLDVLRAIKRAQPNLPIYGFDLITRISRANDNFEEPLYWGQYGARLYQYSQGLDRQLQGQDVEHALDALRAQLPAEYIRDFLGRRLRNHIVNLSTLEMLNDGVFELLVLSSDDTSPYGLGSREKRWLVELTERLMPDDERLLMYPGADEVGCALVARAFNDASGLAPRFAVVYAVAEDRNITAPFEDGPVWMTVERQVRAVGGVIVSDVSEADLVLAVNTPSSADPPYLVATDAEYAQRYAMLRPFVEQMQKWLDEGRQVIAADVAYPNGSDPAFVDLMREHFPLERLAAYGAWNTAGNTIGTALAQGVMTLAARRKGAHQGAVTRFLAHRFLEDWGYQFHVRAQLWDWLRTHAPRVDVPEDEREHLAAGHGVKARSDAVSSDLPPAQLDAARSFVETGLQAQLGALGTLGARWRVKPGSVRFPWRRTFEVDFELEEK